MEKCILYLQWKSDSLVCKDMDQPKIRYETKKSTNIPEKEDCVKKRRERGGTVEICQCTFIQIYSVDQFHTMKYLNSLVFLTPLKM